MSSEEREAHRGLLNPSRIYDGIRDDFSVSMICNGQGI